MSYGTFAGYFALFPDGVEQRDYTRLAWEADRVIDRHTTGADNVRKLKVAFPTDEDTVAMINRCEYALVNIMYEIETAEAESAKARSYVTRADGTVSSALVSSVSSGSESMSFVATSNAPGTSISEAVGSLSARRRLFGDLVREYLSGLEDANGVNLLYMGVYPVVQ